MILLHTADEIAAFIVITTIFVGSTFGTSLIVLSRHLILKLTGAVFLLLGGLATAIIILTVVHNI